MFKQWLNQGRLVLRLEPRGPIMIKSGVDTVDPSQPDMAFVRTAHAVAGDTVYLPGTGLKGALRAHAERLLRGIDVWVCDPLARSLPAEENSHQPLCRKASKSNDPSKPVDTATVARLQCPACRIFGSLAMSGRVSILDAHPWPHGADENQLAKHAEIANRTERRMQAAIDRETGQAMQGGALFEIEVVTGGSFWTEVHLENIQLWQLALLIAVIRDLDLGDFGIGHGKARGLGRVSAVIEALTFESRRTPGADETQLYGTGALVSEGERAAYGLWKDDTVTLPDGIHATTTWRGFEARLTQKQAQQLGDRLLETTLARMLPHLGTLRQIAAPA